MTRPVSRRAFVAGLLAVLFAFGAVLAQYALARRCPVKRPAASAGVFAALGAFRSLAAEIVWFRADRLQNEGRFVELAQLAKALTLAEPHTPEVWSYAAWNLAYNVSVMMPDPADRWQWILSALRLLRDDGLKLNPRAAEIYREIAWLFEFKLGLSSDATASYARAQWREIVRAVQARGAWHELGMKIEVMTRLERELNLTDRADPFYSAIYWAELGLQCARETDRAFLKEIIRQSLTLYQKTHTKEEI